MKGILKSLLAIAGLVVSSFLMSLVFLAFIRLFFQARLIPSGMVTMAPAFLPGDRLLVDCASVWLEKDFQRGDVIVFYPPPVETGGRDLSYDLFHVLGRATGLPYLPCETAFIKRIIALPGETVLIEPGRGVIVNGSLLNESAYKVDLPRYRLEKLADIGTDAGDRRNIRPYLGTADASKKIVVPAGHLFVLGDNRNHSDDSHVFGMVEMSRVIGRVQFKLFPQPQMLNTPEYD